MQLMAVSCSSSCMREIATMQAKNGGTVLACLVVISLTQELRHDKLNELNR